MKGFRASALESVAEGLATEGYLDPREPLTESTALTRVLSAANAAVLSGHIGVDEVRRIFRRYWSVAESGEPDPTEP